MPRAKKRKSRRHPGHLEQLATCFRWHVSIHGRRHRETVETTDRQAAEEFCVQRYAELRKRARTRGDAPAELVRMSDLIQSFRDVRLPGLAPNTRRTYTHALDTFEAYFVDQRGDMRVEDVKTRDVVAYLALRRTTRRGKAKTKTPVSARTVAKDRAMLHALFAHAVELEIRLDNPVARNKADKVDGREPVILTLDEYERLLSECRDQPMLHLYALILGETGARCESEALWLRWEDVDLAASRITIVSGRDGHRTKGGKSRLVPMTPRLADAMREHFASFRFRTYAGQRTPWLIHHTRTRRHYTAGQRVGSFRRAFMSAAKRAELPAGFHQHDLRHGRATDWLARGASVVHVKEALGHSDVRTTLGYSHLAAQHCDALLALPDQPKTGQARAG